MDRFLHYLTLGYLWEGALIAVQLMVAALFGGVLIGFFLALASLSPRIWLWLPVRIYIYVLRGTPVLLQLIIFYNVLPQFGILLSPILSALLALTINETAYCAEIIRGGIISANRDQRLAAQAFGFSQRAEFTQVVIPQALRAILPTLGNESVGLLKSTSLASVVGVAELTMRGQTIVSTNFQFLPVLLASGAIYIILSSMLALGQWWAEQRVSLDARARRAGHRLSAPAVAVDPQPLPIRSQAHRTPGDVLLDVDHLQVAYGDTVVLKDLSLEVRRSQVVVLLGRSGSGKSTLLKAIMALVPVSAGSIRLGGLRIGQTADGRLMGRRALTRNRVAARLGIVFQNFALFDHLTAEENVMSIPLVVQKRSKGEAQTAARRALAQVGLTGFEHRLPHELSGGQQQRVAIARALASDPQLILFDEPTSALDPELVREVNSTIRALAETGLTMVISTHDVGFARTVADQIVFLKGGQLVEAGPPSILDAPRTETFAAYLRQEEPISPPAPQRLPSPLAQPPVER